MVIRTLGDKTPKVADTAWVSEFAYVVGDVEIGEHSSIWPGVTIRGDGEQKIVLGDYVNVQEGSVIHGSGLVIEDRVTIGHSVVVHGDHIGEGSCRRGPSTGSSRTGSRPLVVSLSNHEPSMGPFSSAGGAPSEHDNSK